MNIRNAVAMLGILVAVGGCQSAPMAGAPAKLDNAAFMMTWDTYRHCQASMDDVDAMQADVRMLTSVAAKVQPAVRDTTGIVPEFVKHLMARPAPRLAADPGAMAAACALATGQAALRTERLDLASEMFQTVLRQQGPEYAYYAGQAGIGLTAVERDLQAARNTDPRVLSVSSPASDARPSSPAPFED